MSRLLRPFSIRQYRCLFLGIVIVCAIMAVAAIHLRPDSLVNFPEQRDGEGQRKALAVNFEKNEILDEEKSSQPKGLTNVKFLPVTESNFKESSNSELPSLAKRLIEQNKQYHLDKIADGPIFYGQKDGLASSPVSHGILPNMQNGDIPRIGTRGQLPQNIYLSQQQFQGVVQVEQSTEPQPEPFIPPKRLIHFDLKGAPPKIDYLMKVIDIAAKLGATGLLIEYEDMFPYDGILENISATNHYTKEEVKSLLVAAAAHNLEVIPLVQTFGHLEYVLKLDRFSHLRENPDVPQAVCPSRNESLRLVEQLVDQVMALHPGINYLHIGCDEVFHMAECALCSMKNRDNIFLGHVHHVAKYVRNRHKVVPIIWDDMMRHISSRSLLDAEFDKLVEPMVWVYAENVYHFTGPEVYQRYAEVFPSYWISSSFKGAFGETLVVPDVRRHLENNLRWLQVARAESPKFSQGLRGIAITGWQRYDHFATLCEMLPAAIPSMAVNLLAVSKGFYNDSLAPSLYAALSCSTSSKFDKVPDLQYDKFLSDKMSMCFFPGAPFYKLAIRFLRVEKEVHDFVHLTTNRKGWLTDFNVRHNFSSPARIDELVRDLAYHAGSLHTMARQTIETLKPIFDVNTISEWMEQKLLPLFQQLDRIQTEAQHLRARKYWAQRPVKIYDQWDYYGIKLGDLYNVTPISGVNQQGLPPAPPYRHLN